MAFAPSEIGRRVREQRQEVGVSAEQLARALGVREAEVEQLESGALDPLPGDFILIIARVLKTDFRYFISNELDEIERDTRKIYRALTSPSAASQLAIRRFSTLCVAEWDLERLLEIRPQPLPPVYPLGADVYQQHKVQGAKAALAERQRMGLGDAPIENIFDLLRRQGIRLCRHAIDNGDLSGVTVLHPRAGICVLVNYVEDLYRQFFSAAHEYAHVLFDREVIKSRGVVVSYLYDRQELAEIRANSFASEFLLPSSALQSMTRPRNLEELSQLIDRCARQFKVNTVTVAIKLKTLGWITDRTLESFKKARPVVIGRGDKRDPDIPDDLTPSQVRAREEATRQGINARLLELLRRGLVENVISFGRFAEMLDLTPDEARSFVQATRLAL